MSSPNNNPIPQDWMMSYVNAMLTAAQMISGPSKRREEIMQDAAAIMKMYQVWRDGANVRVTS